MKNLKRNISKIIKEERAKQGLSAMKLANMAGVTDVTIFNYEKEKRNPTLEHTDKILKALGVSLIIGAYNE
jgi:transcriptional regulator with XRE-family HTH domain